MWLKLFKCLWTVVKSESPGIFRSTMSKTFWKVSDQTKTWKFKIWNKDWKKNRKCMSKIPELWRKRKKKKKKRFAKVEVCEGANETYLVWDFKVVCKRWVAVFLYLFRRKENGNYQRKGYWRFYITKKSTRQTVVRKAWTQEIKPQFNIEMKGNEDGVLNLFVFIHLNMKQVRHWLTWKINWDEIYDDQSEICSEKSDMETINTRGWD